MATFRDQNHKLGSTISGAFYATELLQEQVEEVLKTIPEESGKKILKNIAMLQKSISEIEQQTQEIKSIAYRYLNPEEELANVETKFKEENKAVKVLVVEDDSVITYFSKQLLERRGFVVATATDVDSAKMSIKEFAPNLVILDLALPSHLEGVEVLRFIRDNQLPTKCIVVSKIDDESQLADLKSLKPEKIMQKPVPINELMAQINAIIGSVQG